jgi:acyl-CoA thioesterase FadM
MKEYEFNVRYAETDQMGVVYHGNMLIFWDGTRGMA